MLSCARWNVRHGVRRLQSLASFPLAAETNVRASCACAGAAPRPKPSPRARVARPALVSLAYPPMAAGTRRAGTATDPAPSPGASRTPPGREITDPRFHYYSILFAIALLLAALPPEDETEQVAR